MANWPDTLPKPKLDGFGIKPQPTVLRTQMESGARYRQRFTNAPIDVDCNFLLTKEQMATFKNFYDNDIHQGADWFLMSGLDIGNGYTTNSEVHIVGEYEATRSERFWRLSMKLEVRNA